MVDKNSKLTRDSVKWVRDKVKTSYPQKVECAICGVRDNLQLHHYSSISLLWLKWLKGRPIDTDAQILKLRDQFIEEHQVELLKEVVTLCKVCHNDKLHHIYGRAPALATAKKQAAWVLKMKEKFLAKQ